MANAGGEDNATNPHRSQEQGDVQRPVAPVKPALAPKPKLTEKQPVPAVPAQPTVESVPTKVDRKPSPVMKDLSKPGDRPGGNSNPNAKPAANAHGHADAKPNPAGKVASPNAGANADAGGNKPAQRKTIPRPEAWEDDISRNALDDLPFTSLPSPASRDPKDFESTLAFKRLQPFFNGVPIGDFLAKDTSPIPVPEDREGYSAGYDENYWMSGLEDYFKIMSVADSLGVIPRSVLDFGCATGRVIRHFANQSKIPEVWGTDINQRHVRWLYEHLPMNVKPVFNHCIPTLPIPDRSVDIITAFSVFTHIDTFETHWLAELSRIMSDGGMCYLTVHNEDTWEVLREEIDNEKNRLIQSLIKIDPNFATHLMEPMPDGRAIYRFTKSGPYRAQVFHSDNYLRKVWGRFFDVEAIMPCHHVRQTVVVLRKKS